MIPGFGIIFYPASSVFYLFTSNTQPLQMSSEKVSSFRSPSSLTASKLRTREPSSANTATLYASVHLWLIKLNIFASRNSLPKAAIPHPGTFLRYGVYTRPSPYPTFSPSLLNYLILEDCLLWFSRRIFCF